MGKKKSKQQKVVLSKKQKFSELKEDVYKLAGVTNTKKLKTIHKEFALYDFRRRESWQYALDSLKVFEEWRSNPPEKYKAIFKEIDEASKEHQAHVASAKKVFEGLEDSVEELDKLTKEALENAKALKEETLVSIPISFPNDDETN